MVPWSIARLLGNERRPAVTWAAGGAVAFVAFWVVSVLDAVLLGHGRFAEALLAPTMAELWIRLLVAVLLGLLHVERRMRAQLSLLWFVLQEAPDGIQIADMSGRITYSNRAIEEIYGFTPRELQGRNVGEMNADPTVAERVVLPALRSQGRWAGELEVKHKSGRTFPIWLTTSVVANRRGRPAAAIGIVRDISERRRAAEAQRRYAIRLEEATRLKDLFADILRHDLLGPASVLRMSMELLERQPLPAPAPRVLAQARRSCARLLEMLEGAATYARVTAIDQLPLEPLDLHRLLSVVESDFEPLLAEHHARVEYEPAGTCLVRANPILSEVFTNLLSNAVKYGPAGAAVTIRVAERGGQWVVSVADRGEGIRPEDRERIFTRFERLGKEGVKGTGLGLTIARHVVSLHGGEIWVEGRPGGGSVFCVALPKG